jgi:hypothetical protein
MPMMPRRLPVIGGRASRSATSRPLAGPHDALALDDAPRHGEDQRHRHVGRVLGQHARRVGDGDAALARGGTSILSTPVPKLAISLSSGPACARSRGVDAVGDGGHQHVGSAILTAMKSGCAAKISTHAARFMCANRRRCAVRRDRAGKSWRI